MNTKLNGLVDPTWQQAWDLYEGICVLCFGKASSIHEIEPRSRRPKDWWKLDNRVALCTYCHNAIHEGNPLQYAEILRINRDCLLKILGKTIP